MIKFKMIDRLQTKPRWYDTIRESAPLIGIAGTMEGIAIGINSMDILAGIEVAYKSLQVAVGNAVYSSLWVSCWYCLSM